LSIKDKDVFDGGIVKVVEVRVSIALGLVVVRGVTAANLFSNQICSTNVI
jgi:hypothetical protein